MQLRDLTTEEDRWISALECCLDEMPATLRGFHYPGGIAFMDVDDSAIDGDGPSTDRAIGVLRSIRSRSLDRIDAGDW